MSDFVSFRDFYEAVHGREPLPWQVRLAELVARDGWPEEIGVPTGLGKTTCIDIAVWALASQADRDPIERTLPTRIWYVVNRRLLVDAASDHAERLSSVLAKPSHEAITIVADRLASMTQVKVKRNDVVSPLFVSRLRGGSDLGARAPHPAQPAILCATVPMFGSRLLFRGYGSSRGMWPIDAAHAGTDSVVLLDEAHLAEPLRKLVSVCREADANRCGILRAPQRFDASTAAPALLPGGRNYTQMVSLTATGRAGDRFDLNDDDRAHPIVAQRLAATKLTEVVECERNKLAETLAANARELLDRAEDPCSLVVFVNSPRTARGVADLLRKGGRTHVALDPVVLTGQMRELEADVVRRRLLSPAGGAPSGHSVVRDGHLVVIATQTLEVGADLDFDFLVTENAGVRALTQRFGRLNRLGNRASSHAVIVHVSGADGGGLYGAEPTEVLARLQTHSLPVNLSPENIATVFGAPNDAPPRMPELLPGHLWEFAKTSAPPVGAAPPDVFFAGIEEADRHVSVCWRVQVDRPALHVPAAAAEFVDVPIGELRDMLTKRALTFRRIDYDGVTLHEEVDPETLVPGMQIVLHVGDGSYGASGWDPDASADVSDVSPLYRRAVLATRKSVANLLDRQLTDGDLALVDACAFDPDEGADDEADEFAARELLAHVTDEFSINDEHPFAATFRAATFDSAERAVDGSLIVHFKLPRQLPDVRVESLDQLCAAPQAELANHLRSVGDVADSIGRELGLTAPAQRVAALGGRFHDLGKADVRFQRWLGNRNEIAPVAKSSRRSLVALERAYVSSGWVKGSRHELLSVQLLDAALESGALDLEANDADLVRHLVISHHGHGRPLCPEVGAHAVVDTAFEFDGVSFVASTDASRADWQQPQRFRDGCEQFGFWGLALLEAVVRQADHMVSEITEVL